MKLLASGKPFGEKHTKGEAMASIKKTLIEIGEICGATAGEVEQEWDKAIRKGQNKSKRDIN